MSETIWNEKLDFLKAIRTGWCNDDYIQFLVEKVWKINKPVKILDFGCGFGYVGLLLLPMLPKGSTYTGIDFSEILLTEAENIFDGSGYSTRFIKANLSEYRPVEMYDIVISQAVLRHIPDAKDILEKMIQSVVKDGLVVCMEGDLEIEKAGQYFEGFDYTELDISRLHRKMFKKELTDGGRDYRFGIKVPVLMQQLGLKDVGVRMNDCVKFINPFGDKDEHEKQYNAIVKAWGWDKKTSNQEKLDLINTFIQRGLSKEEAEKFVDGQIKISNYVREHKESAFIIQAPGILISYGRK